jgi:hypothetical protein
MVHPGRLPVGLPARRSARRRWYTSGMTGRPRLAAVALTGCLLALLAGCPAPVDPEAGPSTSGQPLPGRSTNASTDLPAYAGPPAGAPPSVGPLTRVRGRVDLTPATPGVFAREVAAVATSDGGALVLLSPAEGALPQSLVTVTPDFALGGSVPLPRVGDVWAMHALGDGAVAVTGRLGDGYGVEVVDPGTGAVRTTVVAPTAGRPDWEGGRSALSPDGATLYLLVSVMTGDDVREQLFAVDTTTGKVTAQRDLADDVVAASTFPIGRQLAGLVARPAGGATVVFDASPTEVEERRIPTLLAYDARLRPVGGPVRATGLAEGAETQSVAGAADGTVFLLVTVREGAWVLGVPDGGGAGPLLAQLTDRIFGYALVVEPAQVWAVTPAATGAQAIDLTTGEVRGQLNVGCEPRLDVRDLYPAPGGALMIGECDTPREDTQMLWFLGPEG